MFSLIGARFTRTLGDGAAGSARTPAEVLAALKRVRRRHSAVCGLIAALEECAAAGCDMRFFQCLGCEARFPHGAASRPAA